jgi:hypothetical protein
MVVCFALQALEAGAAYAIVDEPLASNHERLIFVEDVLTTLASTGLAPSQTIYDSCFWPSPAAMVKPRPRN